MRSALICAVMLTCTASVVAQSPQITSSRPTRATMSADQSPTQGAPARLRSVDAGAKVRPSTKIPPEAPVVTIEGVCDRSPIPNMKDCKTVITRAQMEDMIDLLAPGASPAVRRQFAINYARLLAASEVAHRKHLEKDPEVIKQLQAQLKVTRMEVLAHTLYEQIEKQAETTSMSEIQKYYQEHLPNFDQGEVLRLSLPRMAPTTDGRPLDDSVVKGKAEELRQRAAAGEDFALLQHDAYDNLGIQGIGPSTKLNMVRRTNLPPEEGRVFDLQPGEVSPVIESLGSLVVLKLVSKQSAPLETAQQEIRSRLQQARMQQELDNATKTVKAQFNLKYLDMASAPALFPPPGETRQSDIPGVASVRSQVMGRQGMTPNARRASRRPRR